MNEEPAHIRDSHSADRLANERTFLAWIRTAISIVAFGFVVIKFLMPDKPGEDLLTNNILPPKDNHALLTGLCFVLMGAAISILAYIQYRWTDKQILTGTIKNSFLLPTLLLISVLIICTLLILDFLETTFH